MANYSISQSLMKLNLTIIILRDNAAEAIFQKNGELY